jgi:hypothetical protein
LVLPFSLPAKLTINVIGVVFWQARQIASNAALPSAVKGLGVFILSSARGRTGFALPVASTFQQPALNRPSLGLSVAGLASRGRLEAGWDYGAGSGSELTHSFI